MIYRQHCCDKSGNVRKIIIPKTYMIFIIITRQNDPDENKYICQKKFKKL